ncbi:MAG: transketolase family protein [Clostridia bacterium]
MEKRVATRVAYGEALCEFGADERIVVLEADLAECTMSGIFGKKYPERFLEMGIAEANMITAAAGFSTTGKIVFCHSFAVFTAGRGYDQIRNSCAYPCLNVKIVGSHAGLTVGKDGATHQMLEDLSLMRTLPNMVVLSPCDVRETRAAVRAMIDYDGPCYLRTSRFPTSQATDAVADYHFELGKGVIMKEGTDVTVIATGTMVEVALKAVTQLSSAGICARLIDMHTIKPLDKELILESAKKTGAIVTCEEHNVIGGLGSAVSEVVCEVYPVPVLKVGVMDRFGRSGDAEELLAYYGLTTEKIIERVYEALAFKQAR